MKPEKVGPETWIAIITGILALGAAVGTFITKAYLARSTKTSMILGATSAAAESLSAAAAGLVVPLQSQNEVLRKQLQESQITINQLESELRQALRRSS